jgi:hypothetical protein
MMSLLDYRDFEEGKPDDLGEKIWMKQVKKQPEQNKE